eukprot:724758-Amphidinium_carterae.3
MMRRHGSTFTQRRPPCDLRSQRAADQLGYTAETLRVLLAHPSLAKALAHFIALSGELERRQGALRLYHAVKAIPLRKAQNGIRPILLTTLFKKVNAKTLVATLTPLVAPHLKGRQFGLGQSEGCFLLTAAVMSRLDANPGMAACQLDVKNAFSCVHRAVAIKAMLQQTPVEPLDACASHSHPWPSACSGQF